MQYKPVFLNENSQELARNLDRLLKYNQSNTRQDLVHACATIKYFITILITVNKLSTI